MFSIIIQIDKGFIKFLLNFSFEDLSDILGLSGRCSNLLSHNSVQ